MVRRAHQTSFVCPTHRKFRHIRALDAHVSPHVKRFPPAAQIGGGGGGARKGDRDGRHRLCKLKKN